MKKKKSTQFTPAATILRKILIYGILVFVLLLIQISAGIFSGPGRNVPALVLIAVSALGFFDSEKTGAIAGTAAGWALDVCGGTVIFLMPVVGFFVGYFSGYIVTRLLPRGVLPFGLCTCAVALVNMICSFIYSLTVFHSHGLGSLILHNLLPELGLTLLFGIPVGLVVRLFVRIERRGGQLSERNSDFQ